MNEKLISIAGLSFAGINLIDLILTLQYYEYELNPLVQNSVATFYIVKLIVIFTLTTICSYKLSN